MIYANGLGGLTVLLSLVGVTLSQDPCVNVTISSAADADEIRKSCKIITGDFYFGEGLAETINLDGIEVIDGDVWYTGEGDETGCGGSKERACTAPFIISSSTLRHVNGSFYLSRFTGLQKLLLPKLNRVDGWFSLNWMNELKALDITNLEYVERFTLSADNLESFSLKGLKEFTGPNNGLVNLYVGDKVDNFDGLFKNPLDPWKGKGYGGPDDPYTQWITEGSGIDITAPGLKTLTLGWQRTPILRAYPENDLTITFGGPNSSTTEMKVHRLNIGYGVTKLQKGKYMKNLQVAELKFEHSFRAKQLGVPFDNLDSLQIHNASALTKIVLPPAARNWRDFNLQVYDSANVNWTSDKNDKGEKTWYWPTGDMQAVHIEGNLTNGFFESFLAERGNNPNLRVKDEFVLIDYSGKFDCSPFEQLQSGTNNTALSNHFTCGSLGESSAGTRLTGQLLLGESPWLQVILMVGGVVITYTI